jgi:hypothetical protein
MYLEPADHRPRSLFDADGLSYPQWAAGALTAALVHVGLPLLVLAVVSLLTVAGVNLTPPLPPTPPPPVEQVIQARFLQRGEVVDRRQLPNRQVPILRTDTPEPAPSKQTPIDAPPRERRERQPNSVQDLLQRLSQDAQHFAEREQRRIQEGDPDGVEGGERQASEGDHYAGILSMFFRRGWQVPTTIPRGELQSLTTRVSVLIGDDLRVRAFRVVRGSGNPDYDLAVTQQLQRLVDAQATIPPPPESVAANYVSREVGFNFRGRDAR